jgi:hypothetical protein
MNVGATVRLRCVRIIGATLAMMTTTALFAAADDGSAMIRKTRRAAS